MPRGANLAWPLLLCFLLGACSSPLKQGTTEAAIFLEDIWAHKRNSRLKERTKKPQIREITYSVDGIDFAANLYIPGEQIRGGMVFVPGLNSEGFQNERMAWLVKTLARSGFVVLVPDIPLNREIKIGPKNIDHVVAAVSHLSRRATEFGFNSLGIAGVSYSAGPVLVAALHPSLIDRVNFVITIGGYYDLVGVVSEYTTGQSLPDQRALQTEKFKPKNKKGVWIFARSFARYISDASDRQAVEAYAEQHFRKRYLIYLSPPELNLSSSLALIELLRNKQPDRVQAFYEALSTPVKTAVAAINPAAHDFSNLQAKVIVIHGLTDAVISVSQSRQLRDQLPAGRVRYFEMPSFAHVNFKVKDNNKQMLIGSAEAILAQRDPLQ